MRASATAERPLVVGFATTGRADVLARTIELLEQQTLLPSEIIVSAVRPEDTVGVREGAIPLKIVHEAQGLCAQRNVVLALTPHDKILQFFDDDFLPSPTYLERIAAAFEADYTMAAATGFVLKDGICGPGFDFETGLLLLKELDGTTVPDEEVFNGYGCNFAFRMSAVLAAEAQFDEELPLYGWLEDVDFSRAVASEGVVRRIGSATGVHLGIKQGRTSGVRLGYSQMVNPLYLVKKGTCSRSLAFRLMTQNFVSNLFKSLTPESYIDRRGRLQGNIIGLLQLLKSNARPAKARDL